MICAERSVAVERGSLSLISQLLSLLPCVRRGLGGFGLGIADALLVLLLGVLNENAGVRLGLLQCRMGFPKHSPRFVIRVCDLRPLCKAIHLSTQPLEFLLKRLPCSQC
jgi:hypothetical protein